MNQTKTVHLTSVHPPLDPRIFDRECRTLAAAGYDVLLVAPGDADREVEGVRLRAVRRPSGRLDRVTRTLWQVWRAAVREKAAIYHLHDPELIPVGLLLRLLGRPVIYDAHEDLPRQVVSKGWIPRCLRGVIGAVAGALESLAAQCFSGIVAATPQIGARFPPGKTAVVQNFPPLERIGDSGAPAYSGRPPVAVYAGAITRQRGLLTMLEAVRLLPEGLGARLRLAGRFSPPDLEAEARQAPGWERTEYCGALNPAEVPGVYAGARLGLVLLQPTPAYLESYPTKLFEYMGAGLPVVAADFPLWRSLIEEAGCGMLVDPLNPEEIARAIQYLLTHPTEAEAMGQRGQAAVYRHYNWQAEAAKLLALYART